MASGLPQLQVLNAISKGCVETPLFDQQQTQKQAESLRLCLTKIVRNSSHLVTHSEELNYKTLLQAEEFRAFEANSQALIGCNIELLNDDERKAFFINIYNVLTIHALTEYHLNVAGNSSIKTTLDIPHFWRTFGYRIGLNTFSLDDIEHGILRGNRPHPSNNERMFSEGDPRLKLCLSYIDPRIHFALNCGAKSCPMVNVYSPNDLDDKLDFVTRSYLRQEVTTRDSADGTLLLLPQIFEWYGVDFAPDVEGILRWISKYTDGHVTDLIENLLESNEAKLHENINYFYDWALNQKI